MEEVWSGECSRFGHIESSHGDLQPKQDPRRESVLQEQERSLPLDGTQGEGENSGTWRQRSRPAYSTTRRSYPHQAWLHDHPATFSVFPRLLHLRGRHHWSVFARRPRDGFPKGASVFEAAQGRTSRTSTRTTTTGSARYLWNSEFPETLLETSSDRDAGDRSMPKCFGQSSVFLVRQAYQLPHLGVGSTCR